jgi:hypothetical protein
VPVGDGSGAFEPDGPVRAQGPDHVLAESQDRQRERSADVAATVCKFHDQADNVKKY